MDLPAIVLIEENVRVLEAAKAELCERYGRHYTVHAEPGTEAAVELLERLAADGDDIALVLIGQSAFSATSGSLFDLARQRHPLAKRVLLVGSHAWVDSDRAELIRAAMALGRIDHFVLQPATAPDVVFHEAMSGFLHDWARECLLVPQTVHIVGEGWSGRAYELRSVLESCALPHEFSLADSEKGRQLIERAGPDVRLP